MNEKDDDFKYTKGGLKWGSGIGALIGATHGMATGASGVPLDDPRKGLLKYLAMKAAHGAGGAVGGGAVGALEGGAIGGLSDLLAHILKDSKK